MIILILVNLVLLDETVQLLWYFMDLLPPNRTWRITIAQNRTITTYRLPLQTVGKGDIEQHLINPNTMSTLINETLVRADPHPLDGQTSY
jgi:hypothetical protein